MGLKRARFQLETVKCLREGLTRISSNLIVTKETPEAFLPKLLSKDHHNIIVYQQEINEEKVKIEAKLAE